MIAHWLRRAPTATVSPGSYRSSARSHVGRVRTINEDRMVEAPDRGLWAVIDGMGGHAGGDRAATMVAEALRAIDTPDPSTIKRALHEADAAVRAALPGSGATVAVLSISNGAAHVSWAGDSRVYRLRDGTLERITRDHSVVQEFLDAGLIDIRQAVDHPQGHVVTQAIGATATLMIDQASTEVRIGDTFLLCSDGLTRRVEDPALQRLLAHTPDAADATASAIELALARDGSDNVSVIVVTVE